jgi:hypothetical protein
MEDAATAEISRSQLWQWLHTPGQHLDDGTAIDLALLDATLAQLPTRLGDTRALPGSARLPESIALLAELSRLCPPAHELQTEPTWAGLHDSLSTSRDKHRRNTILVTRKLEAVRGALSSLSTELPGSPVEVYDRLGQVARFGRGRGYSDA